MLHVSFSDLLHTSSTTISGMSDQPTNTSRQDLLHNAVLFLTDSKVASSTLASKISFLEGKGLNESEIQEALQRAGATGGGVGSGQGQESGAVRKDLGFDGGFGYGNPGMRASGYGYGQQMKAPEPPRRDWRDLFVRTLHHFQDTGIALLSRVYCVDDKRADVPDHGGRFWRRHIWRYRPCQSTSRPSICPFIRP